MIVWRPHLPVLASATLVLAASVLAIHLARRELRSPSNVVPFACVIVALLAVAVVRAPTFPTDIPSYAADGRIVAHYHQNPYVVAPGRFPHDALFAGARDATAPYGPVFVGAAAVVAGAGGTHVLWYRLVYQGLAALAVAAALVLLWRARRNSAAIVLVGLHPVIAGTVVNGGHNDALLGLALLAAVLMAERDRVIGSAVVLSLAMLVKATAGLAVVPFAAWVAVKRGRRAALDVLAVCALLVVPVSLAVPGLARSVRSANVGLVTRTSVWNMYPLRAPLVARFGDGAVTQLGLIGVGIAVFLVVRGERDLVDGVAGCLLAFLVVSAYVMPWYTVWALPVAALHPRHPYARLAAWQGTVVVTAFLLPRRLLANHAVSLAFGWLLPALLLVGFAAAVRSGSRRADR